MTTREAKNLIENPPAEIAAEQDQIIKDLLSAILVAYSTAGWSKKLLPVLMYHIVKAMWPHLMKWIKLLRNYF